MMEQEQAHSSSGQHQQSSANSQEIISGAQQQQHQQHQQSSQQMQSPMFTFLWPMARGPMMMAAPGGQGGGLQATGDAGAPHAANTWLQEGASANVVARNSQGYAASGTAGQMVGSVGTVHDPSSVVGFKTGSTMQEMMAGMNRNAMGLQHVVYGQPGWGNYHHQNMLIAGKRNRSDGETHEIPHFESKEEKRRRQVREAAHRYREKKKNSKRDGSIIDSYKDGGDEAEIPGESKEDKRRRQLNKAAQRYRDKKRLLNNQNQARASGQVGGGLPMGVPMGMPTGVGLSMGVQNAGVLQGLYQGDGATMQGGAIQAGVMTGGIPMGATMVPAIGNVPMSLPTWTGLQQVMGKLADDRGQGESADSLVEPSEGSGVTVQ